MIPLYDTHAHLDHVLDLPQKLEQAVADGIKGVVAVGVDLAANQKLLEIKKMYTAPRIFVALGMHPGNFVWQDHAACLQFMREHMTEAQAIGEIGLDYWYKDVRQDKEKKEQQRAIFRMQLELAVEFGRPVVIHSRGAWRDCLDMARDKRVAKAVFHWYSGPVDILKEILDCGYLISATPALLYSEQHQEAVRYTPIEQLLIETDSPVFYRDEQEGFQASPKDVRRTLKLYARLMNIEEEGAAVILNRNAERFFGMG